MKKLKIFLPPLIIMASCLVLFFSGIYATEELGAAILLYTLFYGLFPVLWGILLKQFMPKWVYMILSYFAAGLIYSIIVASLTKMGVIFVKNPDPAYLGLVLGNLFLYLFTLPPAFISFAVVKSVCNIQSPKTKKIMISVACTSAVLYVAVISLINIFAVPMILYTPHDIIE